MPTSTLSSILRRACGLALPVVALLAPVAASAAHRASPIVVRPNTALHMAGTDVYCLVITDKGSTAVACYHMPKGVNGPRQGYAIVVADGLVAVEPGGSTTPVFGKHQPSLATIQAFTGGTAHSSVLDLKLNDIAPIGGTHMAVLVSTAKGGGTAMGVVILDPKGSPITGTYSAGISNQYATVVQITGAGAAKVVYRHAVS